MIGARKSLWRCFVCGTQFPCKHREPALVTWALNGQRVTRADDRRRPSMARQRREAYLREAGRSEVTQ